MSDTRVNIQYSIDLDELPEEVERLLNKCYLQLRASNDLIAHITDKNDLISVATLEDVNELRLQLAKSDHILDDLTKIMSGYMRMSIGAPNDITANAPQTAPIPNNPFVAQAPPQSTIDELQEKLHNFASSIKNEEPAKITND